MTDEHRQAGAGRAVEAAAARIEDETRVEAGDRKGHRATAEASVERAIPPVDRDVSERPPDRPEAPQPDEPEEVPEEIPATPEVPERSLPERAGSGEQADDVGERPLPL